MWYHSWVFRMWKFSVLLVSMELDTYTKTKDFETKAHLLLILLNNLTLSRANPDSSSRRNEASIAFGSKNKGWWVEKAHYWHYDRSQVIIINQAEFIKWMIGHDAPSSTEPHTSRTCGKLLRAYRQTNVQFSLHCLYLPSFPLLLQPWKSRNEIVRH